MTLLKFAGVAAIVLTVAGCSISASNSIGDTAEGRAQIVNSITPGQTTISQVTAQFGRPVSIQLLDNGNRQANFSSYFGASGYASVKFNDATGVVFGVETYSYDPVTQEYTKETSKP